MASRFTTTTQTSPAYARGIAAALALALSVVSGGCAKRLLDQPPARAASRELPADFGTARGPTITAQQHWDQFFADPNLRALIEAALSNNQELNIALQEIIVAKNEAAGLQGEYQPRLDATAGAGLEKVGSNTSQGVSDEAHGVRAHLPDFRFGLTASWEIDAWGKLRNAAKAAGMRYAATVEGKNFIITEIVAEIADTYYELVALDLQIEVLERNIELQERALEVVKLEKEAGRATELAVRKFQAEVLKNQGRQYALEQMRVEAENRINVLVGRYPQPVERDRRVFEADLLDSVQAGLPSELLDNRPDVRQAELMLEAAKLDVKAAKARFYPSLSIEANVGYAAFNARHLLETPESMVYNLAGNLTAPLLNRKAIKAEYRVANAMQIQAVLQFEKTLLVAYTEVANRLSLLQNESRRFERIEDQVKALEDATEASTVLYRSARADYMEVLMTRRDVLDAQMELIEARKSRLQAMVKIYQALGGGWHQEAQRAEQ
ncbi:MAG: efflux transporter outer membrane subunit [Nannocystaceae bacterium]